ncbi:hypothetical protein [Roseiflexus castenholzii]|jgi:uncharacterized protein YoxC|uniref:Uncharacterized protein n=1 Tax=Roseiflexus castenholzii (strain DSM 13941 / HLO8) TaxID=383372 RepID=A7NR70_ROSCS|nr:hypothetical protein [Roseiflexus castenholzii]ABU60066.1 conserved hypothetical protein [Roseiflexus castenholzii DSM 13941]
MSEQMPNTGQPEPQKETPDLTTELREMGQQLEALFRAFIESERAKQMQATVAKSVQDLAAAVRQTAEKIQSDPRFQQVEDRGRQALERARESQVFHDVQEALVNGLEQINAQLHKLVEKLETERAAAAQTGQGDEANPPVEHVPLEAPATGETKKLDA